MCVLNMEHDLHHCVIKPYHIYVGRTFSTEERSK
jgi:hypothetical protein